MGTLVISLLPSLMIVPNILSLCLGNGLLLIPSISPNGPSEIAIPQQSPSHRKHRVTPQPNRKRPQYIPHATAVRQQLGLQREASQPRRQHELEVLRCHHAPVHGDAHHRLRHGQEERGRRRSRRGPHREIGREEPRPERRREVRGESDARGGERRQGQERAERRHGLLGVAGIDQRRQLRLAQLTQRLPEQDEEDEEVHAQLVSRERFHPERRGAALHVHESRHAREGDGQERTGELHQRSAFLFIGEFESGQNVPVFERLDHHSRAGQRGDRRGRRRPSAPGLQRPDAERRVPQHVEHGGAGDDLERRLGVLGDHEDGEEDGLRHGRPGCHASPVDVGRGRRVEEGIDVESFEDEGGRGYVHARQEDAAEDCDGEGGRGRVLHPLFSLRFRFIVYIVVSPGGEGCGSPAEEGEEVKDLVDAERGGTERGETSCADGPSHEGVVDIGEEGIGEVDTQGRDGKF
mmetsp:Transcript_25130/g.45476  ORF Transcript_25130/g.45476 Transcript_25130/m.45476 type:complete len:464 (-) Transcript_25130:172-1563(-)